MMDNNHFAYLLDGYENGRNSQSETSELVALFADASNQKTIEVLLTTIIAESPSDQNLDTTRFQSIIDRILDHSSSESSVIEMNRRKSKRWYLFAAAAAAVVTILFGTYF